MTIMTALFLVFVWYFFLLFVAFLTRLFFAWRRTEHVQRRPWGLQVLFVIVSHGVFVKEECVWQVFQSLLHLQNLTLLMMVWYPSFFLFFFVFTISWRRKIFIRDFFDDQRTKRGRYYANSFEVFLLQRYYIYRHSLTFLVYRLYGRNLKKLVDLRKSPLASQW